MITDATKPLPGARHYTELLSHPPAFGPRGSLGKRVRHHLHFGDLGSLGHLPKLSVYTAFSFSHSRSHAPRAHGISGQQEGDKSPTIAGYYLPRLVTFLILLM